MGKRLLRLVLSLAGALALHLGGVARAQDGPAQSGPDVNDQYRCEANWTRCAYFRCPPGEVCTRTSDWETRDYSRGVDGDVSARDQFSTGEPAAAPSFDRRYERSDASGQAYDRRYDQRSDAGGYDERYSGRRGEGYDEDGYDVRRDEGGVNDYARNGGSPRAMSAPTGEDEDQNTDPRDEPGYSYQRAPSGPPARQDRRPEWRCADDGYRCAYFRCDADGDDCHRISGWASRADIDRRPDWDGW